MNRTGTKFASSQLLEPSENQSPRKQDNEDKQKIIKLKESLARFPDQTHLHSRLDDLNLQIQDEVLRLADR